VAAAFTPSILGVHGTPKHGLGKTVLAAEGGNMSGPPYAGPSSKPILDAVRFPQDMKALNLRELKQVSFH